MFATTYLYVPVSFPWSKFLGFPLIQFVFVVYSAVPIGARVTILILKVSITLPSFLASDGEVVAAVEAPASIADYVAAALDVAGSVGAALEALPGARFERVLHPVFEQDEATLIAVGCLLGGLVGLAQVPLY